jgi:hypothetical protein
VDLRGCVVTRRGILLLLLALGGCEFLTGRITAPRTCLEYREQAVPARNPAGDSVFVVTVLTCVRWSR